MNEKHLGSSLDDFLAEEGQLAEAEAVASKRVLAFQIAKLMATAVVEGGAGAPHEHQPCGGRSAAGLQLRIGNPDNAGKGRGCATAPGPRVLV